MALEDFETEEKTSSPTDSDGPSTGGIDDFLDNGDDEVELSGGYSIPANNKDQIDTEVVKVFGGPGTGKTTTMVGNTEINDFQGIMERMFKNMSPDKVMLIAYTRAAADEAKDRLVELTDVTKTRADDRITTIHSMAMRFNNLGPKNIVEIRWANDKYNFCEQVGLEFQINGGDDDEQMMAEPDDQGHLFFKALGWLKSKLMSPEEFDECPLSSG
jgi:DNA helicase-2/ATP-dependent DNA helicase PcrA